MLMKVKAGSVRMVRWKSRTVASPSMRQLVLLCPGYRVSLLCVGVW